MKRTLVLIAISLTILVGCVPKAVQVPEPPRAAVKPSQPQGEIQSPEGADMTGKKGGVVEEDITGADRDRGLTAGTSSRESSATSQFKDVLFDFDSYAIKSDYLALLREVRDWLSRNKEVRVVIEGHCDERGTAVYNLALGQKRAEVVRDYLVKGGIDEKRVKTISYGNEMPADPGHAEEAWAKNRRAHLRIDKKG
jgi:peptidoglycan-associated lipoprotein